MTSPRPQQSPPGNTDARARGLVWFDDPAAPPATDRLSRERVVAAAIAHADADPGGEVTMRALADRLGTRSPMALYRYVGSKDGLTDLMADAVYGEIEVPAGAGWRAGLRGMGLSGWAAVQRHPWVARLAYSRPPLGPNALALYDAGLALVEPLGLSAATRMGFVSTVLGQVLGKVPTPGVTDAIRARLAKEKDAAIKARLDAALGAAMTDLI